VQNKLFDNIKVDFGGVDLLVELWWELGCFHQLLVSRARHFDEGQTQNWWLFVEGGFGEEKRENFASSEKGALKKATCFIL
jgi:hypothetical protein